MNILITGGCGFIGTNAAVYFSQKGHKVLVADNFFRKGSKENLDFLNRFFPKINCLEVDIVRNKDFLKDLRGLEKQIDVIIHAAAQVAVTSSVSDPVFDFNVNALGTLNVLEAARRLDKKPVVIFTSTNKVYGGLEEIGIVEKKSRYEYLKKPFGISEKENLDFHSPYGCSKGCADQYARDYYRIYGLPTIVFRQSCIYGPHQFGIVDQGWVAFLAIAASLGEKITVYGNGKQVRDVLFADDLNRAFDLAIQNIEKTEGQVYNIGGGIGNTLSVLELISVLREKVSGELRIDFADWRPGDQRVYISDIRKAEKDFGWRPEVDFERGFDIMFRWLKNNKQLFE